MFDKLVSGCPPLLFLELFQRRFAMRYMVTIWPYNCQEDKLPIEVKTMKGIIHPRDAVRAAEEFCSAGRRETVGYLMNLDLVEIISRRYLILRKMSQDGVLMTVGVVSFFAPDDRIAMMIFEKLAKEDLNIDLNILYGLQGMITSKG